MILLRLVATPTAIAIGKLLFNLLFLGVLEVVTVLKPIYSALFEEFILPAVVRDE